MLRKQWQLSCDKESVLNLFQLNLYILTCSEKMKHGFSQFRERFFLYYSLKLFPLKGIFVFLCAHVLMKKCSQIWGYKIVLAHYKTIKVCNMIEKTNVCVCAFVCFEGDESVNSRTVRDRHWDEPATWLKVKARWNPHLSLCITSGKSSTHTPARKGRISCTHTYMQAHTNTESTLVSNKAHSTKHECKLITNPMCSMTKISLKCNALCI